MAKINPFACPSWEKQNYRMTSHRAEQLECLFGKTVEQVKAVGRNKGKYPAYLGLKHNLAKMENGLLVPGSQWGRREEFDRTGYP